MENAVQTRHEDLCFSLHPPPKHYFWSLLFSCEMAKAKKLKILGEKPILKRYILFLWFEHKESFLPSYTPYHICFQILTTLASDQKFIPTQVYVKFQPRLGKVEENYWTLTTD